MKNLFYFLMLLGLMTSCNSDDDENQPTNPPAENNIPSPFSAVKGLFDGEGVGAAMHLKDDVIILFNKAGDKYAWLEDEEIKIILDINDSESIFRFSELSSVGAGALSRPNRLYIFDETGENYTFANFDEDEVVGGFDNEDLFSWSSGSSETNFWGPNNSIAFDRVSAFWNLSDPGEDCFDAVLDYDVLLMADGNGDELQPYSLENAFFSDGPFPTEIWTAENNCGGPDGIMPFERIGAACQYVLPNKIMNIFFNHDGTQMVFYTLSEGEFSEIYELY